MAEELKNKELENVYNENKGRPLDRLRNYFFDNPKMLATIDKIEEINEVVRRYYPYRPGDTEYDYYVNSEKDGENVIKEYNIYNEEFKKWLKFYDGGYISCYDCSKDHIMFLTYMDQVDLDNCPVFYETFSHWNKQYNYAVKDNYFIIGVYFDNQSKKHYICISNEKNDQRIYLVPNGAIFKHEKFGKCDESAIRIWNSFTDFLTEIVDKIYEQIQNDEIYKQIQKEKDNL